MDNIEVLILVITAAVMALAVRGIRRMKQEQRNARVWLLEKSSKHPMQDHNPGAEAPVEKDSFRFSPELFEHRARVTEVLDAEGFAWLSHYSSVDCLHDLYGIEVCGIHERGDAKAILRILMRLFPDWKPG